MREVAEGVLLYEIHGQHHYKHVPSGTWMRSVSRITKLYPPGEGLTRWMCSHGSFDRMQEELQKSALRGTTVHKGIQSLLGGQSLSRDDYDAECWKHLSSFLKWYLDHSPHVHAVEETVYDLRRRIAGTLDLRCSIKGVHTVVDFKTSSGIYRNMELQCNEYGWLFNECHKNGHPVEQIAILRTASRHKASYEFKTWKPCDQMHKVFVHLHHIDFDTDPELTPRIPREPAASLVIPRAPVGQPFVDEP